MDNVGLTMGIVVLGLGGVSVSVCYCMLVLKGFQKHLGWGFTCLLGGLLGTAVFVSRYWKKHWDLGILKLVSCTVVAGALMYVSSQEPGVFYRYYLLAQAQFAAETGTSNTATIQNSKSLAIAQKRLSAAALFNSLNQWAKELEQKRAKLNSAHPAEIHAFNQEYAQYQILLRQYNARLAELNAMERRM